MPSGILGLQRDPPGNGVAPTLSSGPSVDGSGLWVAVAWRLGGRDIGLVVLRNIVDGTVKLSGLWLGEISVVGYRPSMTTSRDPLYTGYHYPAHLISYVVWLYFRFPLSLHMVEEMLAARGVSVVYETIRQ